MKPVERSSHGIDLDVELAHFFEVSLDLLTVAGLDGYFKRLSPMWTKTLGWTTEELLSKPNIEFVHPDDRARTLRARANLKEGIPLHGLVNRYLCRDGSHRWLDWKSFAYLEGGLVYAVARDVTEQREAEAERQRIQEQLVLAERMASIGRLAAGVAHEINNPLSCVMANLREVAEELGDAQAPSTERAAELKRLLDEAREDAERMKKIVQGLGTFARLGVERRFVLSPRPVLEQTLLLISGELRRRARLVEDYGPMPLVRADQARLAEIFRHLLFNAAEAIAEGKPEENEILVVTSTDDEGNAVVEIRDTGHGIAPAIRSRIFEPFFTTRPVGSGTGLGLSICHNTVAAMNGRIEVASEEGRGATFRVVLPPA